MSRSCLHKPAVKPFCANSSPMQHTQAATLAHILCLSLWGCRDNLLRLAQLWGSCSARSTISKETEPLKYFCWCAPVTEKISELAREPIPEARGQEDGSMFWLTVREKLKGSGPVLSTLWCRYNICGFIASCNFNRNFNTVALVLNSTYQSQNLI